MKKIAFSIALGFIVLFTGSLFAREPLTFEERVEAQEAIERVYYSHRIWPKENPQPKPPFEQMVTKEQIEAKVTDYLKKSAALDQFWQRPIEGKQLQAEMDRMAKGTKDPQTLNELFTALNNDPYLIAECLARPVLADRLVRNWYANDERFHQEARAKAEEALKTLTPEYFCEAPGAQHSKITYVLDMRKENFEEMPGLERNEIKLSPEEFQRILTETPEQGKISTIEETNESFIIKHTKFKSEGEIEIESLSWQKKGTEQWLKECGVKAETPKEFGREESMYLPPIMESSCEDVWLASGLTAPLPRTWHTAVWTGNEMIIWGGYSSNTHFNSGGRYNPSTDTWLPTSMGAFCPMERRFHTAVWTGSEMIIWGGISLNDYYPYVGGRYNATTDSWLPTSGGSYCPPGMINHSAVWTGTEMIIWGPSTGGIYSPIQDTWREISNVNAPPNGEAVWTASEMIVWGGVSGVSRQGGRYNPLTDTWTTTTLTEAPSERYGHTAIWTGSEMIIWGGRDSSSSNYCKADGGRYNPTNDTWIPISIESCPVAMYDHTSVWTGTEMIVWGGRIEGYSISNNGGRYNPNSDTWVSTSVGANVPSGERGSHTAVWTESEMIIWCGGSTSTGSRYNPAIDQWIPVSASNGTPIMTHSHTSIWTGLEMIVCGGKRWSTSEWAYFGAIYNPVLDLWTQIEGYDRLNHTAIWTGSEMIIWGGSNSSNSYNNTGRKYNPVSNSWLPTSININSPSARYDHSAVWTGTEMIIWGGRDSLFTQARVQNTIRKQILGFPCRSALRVDGFIRPFGQEQK